jgi:hypothetical protein
VPGPVEFLSDPDPRPAEVDGEVDAEDRRPPRRRWPLPAALALAAVLVALWATLRPGARPLAANRPTSTAPSFTRSAPTAHSGPPGCPPGVFCDVSRDQVPNVLAAVRRHFPGARTLTTYTVLRTGSSVRGGGLEYRQDAFTVGDGLLVITVQARISAPPYPSFSLRAQGRAATLQVSLVGFDLDLRFTGVSGPPISGQRLVALSDETALTDVA